MPAMENMIGRLQDFAVIIGKMNEKDTKTSVTQKMSEEGEQRQTEVMSGEMRKHCCILLIYMTLLTSLQVYKFLFAIWPSGHVGITCV